MSEIADILKAAHEIFNDGDVTVSVDSRNLGMAYAIPRGLEDTVVESYGPWYDTEMKQVFYKESSIVRSVLAEIQLILTWRYSNSQQYIIEAYLTKNVITIDPTASVSIRVRFDSPRPYGDTLEAYQIPFVVEVNFDPVGGNTTTIYRGVMRTDGTGTFEEN
jgi:hypothetical protein